MAWICGKCEKICEQIEVDGGGPEEFWGAIVHHAVYEDVSDCCQDSCYTLKEWIQNGWDIPADPIVMEYFVDEGIVEPHQ